MRFPLAVSDVSLWLAITAIILLVTSELIFSLPEYSARLRIEKKNLRLAALGSGIGFLVTVMLRVFQ